MDSNLPVRRAADGKRERGTPAAYELRGKQGEVGVLGAAGGMHGELGKAEFGGVEGNGRQRTAASLGLGG